VPVAPIPMQFSRELLYAGMRAFNLRPTDQTACQLRELCMSLSLQRAKAACARQARADALPDLPTAAYASFALACARCNNTDARAFDTQCAEGDIACIKCGTIAVDHALFTGVAECVFEDDDPADAPKQHAVFPVAYAYLFSDEHAMRMTAGPWKRMAYTCDVDLLRFQTSTRCRDTDKQRAVDEIEQAAERLGTPKAARREAIEMFARLRDAYQRLVSKRLQQTACLLVCHAAYQWVKCVVPRRWHADKAAPCFSPPAAGVCDASQKPAACTLRKRTRDKSPDWLVIA
jgi:hypothetical protein